MALHKITVCPYCGEHSVYWTFHFDKQAWCRSCDKRVTDANLKKIRDRKKALGE